MRHALQDAVLLRSPTRTYRAAWERWHIGGRSLAILTKLVSRYRPGPEHFTAGSNPPPGHTVLSHLHQVSPVQLP